MTATAPARRTHPGPPVRVGAAQGRAAPVPCAARPSTSFRHLDGPCRCFFGGPAPEFGPLPAPVHAF